MSDFFINPRGLNVQAGRIEDISKVLRTQAYRVSSIIPSMSAIGLGSLVSEVENIHSNLIKRTSIVDVFGDSLREIILRYLQAEEDTAGSWEELWERIREWFENLTNGSNGQSIWDVIQEWFEEHSGNSGNDPDGDGLSGDPWAPGEEDDTVGHPYTYDGPIDPYMLNSALYDDKGQYGGNQGGLAALLAASDPYVRDILQRMQENFNKRGTDMLRPEILFERANSEGCGYVAIANAILEHYKNDPDGFYEAFHFPLMHNGDYNYDMLFAELYSSLDNIGADGQYDAYADQKPDEGLHEDSGVFYQPWNDNTGNGTTAAYREYCVEVMLDQYGIEATYESNVDVNAGNFRQYCENGSTVIMCVDNIQVYNVADGKYTSIENPHAMVVTGVLPDGRFVVSSWGQEYYVDPYQLSITGEDGTDLQTSIYFDTMTITN